MDEKPLIIALASGKGGVGKTMLTVACAYELSYASRTLLVDLDFFNRGLSGLFGRPLPVNDGGHEPIPIDRPEFLKPEFPDPTAGEPKIEGQAWEFWQIDDKLFHIHFPDTSNREDDALERGPDVSRRERILLQAKQLKEWLLRVAKQFEITAIVLDCHGGPDPMSFAAAFVADHTLLVSEPDRITLHGTLNFLRKLWRICGEEAPDVRLVFNKVIPQFRVRFLQRFYNATLRKEFFDESLLSVFPLETYLTKAFEQTPILTKVYPHSLLARKMQLLLRDLLYPNQRNVLRRITICQPSYLRRFRYYTMGKVVWFYDHTIILGALSALWIIFALSSLVGKVVIEFQSETLMVAVDSLEDLIEPGQNLFAALAMFSMVWLLASAIWLATVRFDRQAILNARLKRNPISLLWWLALAVIWIPGLLIASNPIRRLLLLSSGTDKLYACIPPLLLILWTAAWLGFRSYRQVRYTDIRFEVILQVLFSIYLLCGLVLFAIYANF